MHSLSLTYLLSPTTLQVIRPYLILPLPNTRTSYYPSLIPLPNIYFLSLTASYHYSVWCPPLLSYSFLPNNTPFLTHTHTHCLLSSPIIPVFGAPHHHPQHLGGVVSLERRHYRGRFYQHRYTATPHIPSDQPTLSDPPTHPTMPYSPLTYLPLPPTPPPTPPQTLPPLQ